MTFARALLCLLLGLSNLPRVIYAEIRIENAQQVTIDTILEDTEAMFGPPLPDIGLSGYVVQASPLEACTAILPPPTGLPSNDQSNQKVSSKRTYIAVIRRSSFTADTTLAAPNCTFEVQVLNAQRAGYAAAVVHNVGSESTFRMNGGPGSQQISIPSVVVGESNGRLLVHEYAYWSNFSVVILPNSNSFNLLICFIPLAVVAVVSLLTPIVFFIIRVVYDRRRARRERLTRADLEAYPTCQFHRDSMECARFDCCAICLEDYVEDDRLRVLPCLHAYHMCCIDQWLLTKKRVCPVCKQPLLTRREARELERGEAAAAAAAAASTEPVNTDETDEHTLLLAASQQGEPHTQSASATQLDDDEPLLCVHPTTNSNTLSDADTDEPIVTVESAYHPDGCETENLA